MSRELGNTVGRIETPQLVQTAPVTNITQVLSGRVAGVNVMQSNGVTGQSARIRVRGISSVSLSNDPVVYIDGVRVASESPAGGFIGGGTVSHLNDLNPEEIENIEIVKGPSAATLYGTQAANGVIRVTTKRGRAGAPQWNVWLEGGLLKDTYEYPSTWFSSAVGSTTAACFPYQQALGQCQIDQLHKLSLLENPETTPFGTGNREQAGASVSGGSEVIRYFVSADWERELGLLKLADTEVDFLKEERGVDEIPVEQRRPAVGRAHPACAEEADARAARLALQRGHEREERALADLGLLQPAVRGEPFRAEASKRRAGWQPLDELVDGPLHAVHLLPRRAGSRGGARQ